LTPNNLAPYVYSILYGKDESVTSTVFHSELPDDCVITNGLENEMVELEVALLKLCRDKALRDSYGKKAMEWAAKTFTADIYARELVEVCEDIVLSPPIESVKSYIQETIGRWSKSIDMKSLPETTAPLKIFDLQPK
jgi:hypothetical protein